MRNYCFKMSLTKILASLLLAATLASCGDNVPSAGTTTTTVTPTPTAPAGLALGTSTNFIVTDNATAATLTATLVDSSNAVMEGVPVSFSTTSGNLNASTATTDASGQAIVTLKSGLADFSNRTATVTASVTGVASASVPVLIRGSTISLTMATNTIQVGAGTLSATATIANSAGLGLPNQNVRFSIGATSTGAATLSAATLTTDATGVTSALTLTPTAAGTVVLTAEWLDSTGAVTATATKDIFVTAASGTAFAITTPVGDPTALTSGATQTLIATVPTTIPVLILGVPTNITVTDVRISATSGTWTGTSPVTGPATSIFQTPSANAVAASYTAPASSGSVTVQVDALGTVGGVTRTTLSSLSRTFVVSAPSTAAAKLFLSASASTIVPSSGSNVSTATLEAVVRDASNNAVGGAAVMFGLLGTTGSGESVSPAVAITDSFGKASTTFVAGSAPTLAAIHAQASIVGQVCDNTSLNLPPATESNNLCDTTPLMVSSSAVSVTVGFGTTVEDTANATQYKLPGSVLVVNSNGSPVAGATVTLTSFPTQYRNGEIYIRTVILSNGAEDRFCDGPADPLRNMTDTTITPSRVIRRETTFVDAEDINRNGILEASEDTQGNGFLETANEDTDGDGFLDAGEDINANGWLDFSEDLNGNTALDSGEDLPTSLSALSALAVTNNGLLSPPQAAGGSVPLTVTTDSNGAATFFLQYPKSSALFINTEVTARVIVMGTESTARTSLVLPMSVPDAAADNCPLARIADY